MQTKAGSPHISGRLGRIRSGQYILELADMLGLYSLLGASLEKPLQPFMPETPDHMMRSNVTRHVTLGK